MQHGVNRDGKHIHYYFNYSADNVKFTYNHAGGTGLLGGASPGKGQEISLAPWDLAIIEER